MKELLRLGCIILGLLISGLACNLPQAGASSSGESAPQAASAGDQIDQDSAPSQAAPATATTKPTQAPAAAATATPMGGGGHLVYLSDQENATGDIYLVELQGGRPGQPINLTHLQANAGLIQPSWRPGTETITVIVNNFDSNQSAVMSYPLDADGMVVTYYEDNSNSFLYSADWSPDGSEFIFTQHSESGADLMLFVIGGAGPLPIANGPGDQIGLDYGPAGTGILYFESFDMSEANAYFSGSLYLLPSLEAEPVLIADDIVGLNYARFSPDGSQIVYDSIDSGNLDIYVMDGDGSNRRQLTTAQAAEANASWSPDGRYILFTRQLAEDDRDIYLMKADGSDLRPFIQAPGYQDEAAWGR